MSMPLVTEDLLERIRTLPQEKIAEVVDFVEFLHLRGHRDSDHALVDDWARISQAAFDEAWDSPEDDVYNTL